ncbi:MAG: type II toxin-antitoxin system PemK/MazF family toxin [Dermatophilaceae bacterium]
MANSLLRSILGTVQREIDRALRRQRRAGRRPGPTATVPSPAPGRTATPSGGYPGDFRGDVEIRYAPHPDGEPDPGEIVWAWVPYEEDHSQGKDRPVLLIGHDGPWLLALQMTSRDHDRDEHQERRAGRVWVDIGSGAWDRQGRPSEVRVNRILRIDPDRIRREGAVLARDRFDAVAAGVLQHT